MTPFTLFVLQSTFSLVAFALIGWWYVGPRLAQRSLEDALVPLLLVHVFRYTPLTLLVPGQIAETVPREAATAIAYGDLVSALLALVAVLALRYRAPGRIPLTWLFTVVGVGDIIMAAYQGIGARLYEHGLGFNWYILNFYVPALIVTHVMIATRLLRRVSASNAGAT